MSVPLLDLKAQYTSIKAELDAAVAAVIESQYFILGPSVETCEKACAAYCRTPHAIGVSSGTDALLVALMAEGIGAGDEVITSPYTFFATGGSIARLGATPVYVDIDPDTYNINPKMIEAKITPRTKAIMPVHLFGQMADMDPIMAIAQKHNLAVIEDAAQAIGSEYKGRRAGTIGQYGCFSFFPSKNLGCFGDGGLVTTTDPKRAELLSILRVHGSKPKYYHKFIGGNFRLDALQAAVVTVKLKHLDAWTQGRQRNALRYHELFKASGLVGDCIQIPSIPASTAAQARTEPSAINHSSSGCTCRHIFNQYVIRAKNRDGLLKHMKDKGVGSEVYYPVPLHLQECFAYLGYTKGSMPESERAASETVALPIYPELTDAQASEVVAAVQTFYRKA